MKKITKGKKKGFTLIELIAVIAILAILAAIIIPNVITYINNANESAKKTNAATAYSAIISAETDLSNNNPTKAKSIAPEGWNIYNETKKVSDFSGKAENDGISLPSNIDAPGRNSVGDCKIADLPNIANGTMTANNTGESKNAGEHHGGSSSN